MDFLGVHFSGNPAGSEPKENLEALAAFVDAQTVENFTVFIPDEDGILRTVEGVSIEQAGFEIYCCNSLSS